MSDRIDEIVGSGAFDQVDKLIEKLGVSNNLMKENLASAIKLNAAIGGAKSFKEYVKSVEDAEKKLNDLKRSQINLEKSELQLQQKRDQLTAKQIANDQKIIASEQRKSKTITEQSRLYVQLSNTLERLRKDAQDVAAQFGTNSFQFKNASKAVIELDARLKDIDKQLGKSQRFVGEYERAGTKGFNRLGNSINQITREFPAFAFSAQTGFLALSNNIPIFVDEIVRTKNEVAALRAEGQKVPGTLKQIASSFFSWMTLLSVAVSLLTIYGKEVGNFVSSLFKGKKAIDTFTESMNKMNEAYRESNKNAGKEISDLKILTKAVQDVNIPMKDRLEYAEELREKWPETYKNMSDEKILTGQIADETKRLTEEIIKQARARAINEKIADLEGQILDKQIERQKTFNARANELSRAKPQFVSGASAGERGLQTIIPLEAVQASIIKEGKADLKEIDDQIKSLRDQQKFLEGFTTTASQASSILSGGDGSGSGSGDKTAESLMLQRLKLRQAELEGIRDINKRLVDDESQSLDDRLEAYSNYEQNLLDLIENSRQQQLQKEDLTKIQLQTIDVNANNERQQIFNDGISARYDIRKKAIDKEIADNETLFKLQIDNAKKADKALLDNLSLAVEQRQALLNESAQRELVALAQSYANGEINAEEYAQKRLEIQRKLNEDLLNQEIKNIELIISLQKAAGKDTADNEKKLAELKQRLSKETTDAQIQDLEKLAEREKELKEKRMEIAQELGNFAIAMVQAEFQESEYKLQKEGEQIDINRAKEVEAVERSILSEQDKAARIAIIDAKAQSQKEALERRQRQLDIDRAKFEKSAGIARIIVDTASAVAEALPNVPLSILVGALGAAQLATAVAAPLPKFEKGGKMKKTGLAEFGHGTELRIDPDGTTSLTPSTPTVGMVKQGTEFISNRELIKLLAKPDPVVYSGGMQIDLDKVIESQERTRRDIVAAVSLNNRRGKGVGYYSSAKGRNYINRNI